MNKRYFSVLLCSALTAAGTIGYAQKSGLSIHIGANDFYGPQTGKYFTADKPKYKLSGDNEVLDTVTRRVINWRVFGRVTYWHQINKHFDLSLGLNLGNVDYPDKPDDSAYIARTNALSSNRGYSFLAELDARFNYNILPKEDYIVAPYVFAGITGSAHNGYLGAAIPLGIGANINLSKNDDVFLNLETGYKIGATDHDQNHLQHLLGVSYWFSPGYHKPKAEPVAEMPPPPAIADSDGDGINDDADECPSIAGTEQFNGCPDSDGDGISDKNDACPLVAGLAQFNGCPDSDGDGISDKDDKCPYVAGTADRQGCPVPDKDGDGFDDDQDKCPDVFSKTNGGCPEIRREVITQVEKAAKAIFFETGKAQIKKNSYKSLDAVAGILRADATLYADIEGHTDDVGDDASNMTLSQNRAQAVKDYLVSKGISGDRLTAQGFGETQPVADNKTAPGRAQNRRTVIRLRNFAK